MAALRERFFISGVFSSSTSLSFFPLFHYRRLSFLHSNIMLSLLPTFLLFHPSLVPSTHLGFSPLSLPPTHTPHFPLPPHLPSIFISTAPSLSSHSLFLDPYPPVPPPYSAWKVMLTVRCKSLSAPNSTQSAMRGDRDIWHKRLI